jgi:peptidylprolyl isomerase
MKANKILFKTFNSIQIRSLISLMILFSSGCIFSKKDSSKKGLLVTQAGTKLDLTKFKQHKNTGILHHIIKEGSGIYPIRGETVSVHYTGWLLEGNDVVGKKFDSSVDRGQKFEFPIGLGYVIAGWDMMVADMKPGEKRIVVLPADMAYGQRGAGALIPPYATLIFEIELFESK